MKYSTKVSDAVHILAFIALNPGADLSSNAIAVSLAGNPARVRQLMSALRRQGLLHCTPGHPQPRLSRPAADISLLQIYRAMEGDTPLLHLNTHTNPDCGVGVNVQLALQTFFDQVQQQAEQAMDAISLQQVLDEYAARLSGHSTAEYSSGKTGQAEPQAPFNLQEVLDTVAAENTADSSHAG